MDIVFERRRSLHSLEKNKHALRASHFRPKLLADQREIVQQRHIRLIICRHRAKSFDEERRNKRLTFSSAEDLVRTERKGNESVRRRAEMERFARAQQRTDRISSAEEIDVRVPPAHEELMQQVGLASIGRKNTSLLTLGHLARRKESVQNRE